MIRCTSLLELRWPLGERTGNANAAWSERAAVVVVLQDHAGRTGLGEAAPLPGFSRDTLDDAVRSLQPLVGHVLHEPSEGADILVRLAAVQAGDLSPAARHALETALLDLWSRQAGVPAWQMLGGTPSAESVPVACLLPTEPAAALARARLAHAAGCTTFKVKLRARELAADVDLLRTLRRELGDTVALRADGNQALNQRLLEGVTADLRAIRLEWIEEPWPDAVRSPPDGLALALDESLAQDRDPGRMPAREVCALVLKPSLLGGLVVTRALMAGASGLGLACAVSHQFEGPVGFQSAAALALAAPPGGVAHGLGAHEALAPFGRPPALAPRGFGLRRVQAPGLGVERQILRPFVHRVSGAAL